MALPLPNAWTETELATLLRLWDEGKSAGEIALVLGRSRNAVVGRIHREREKHRAKGESAAGDALSRAGRDAKVKHARRVAIAKPEARRAPFRFVAPIEEIITPPEHRGAPARKIAPVIEAVPAPAVAAPAVAPEIEAPIVADTAAEPAPKADPKASLPPLPPLYFRDETWDRGRCRAPLFADKIDPEAPVFCGARCGIEEAFCKAHQRLFYVVPVRPEKGRAPILPAPRGRR